MLCNFAAIERLDLVREYLRGNGRVVEAINREIELLGSFLPELAKLDRSAWFGKPVKLKGKAEIDRVDVLRKTAFGGSSEKPLEHLGESQTLHVLSNHDEFRDSEWITDDRSAFRLAKKRGIVTRSSVDVLKYAVALGELTKEEALAVCEEIVDHERGGLLFPPSSAAELVR